MASGRNRGTTERQATLIGYRQPRPVYQMMSLSRAGGLNPGPWRPLEASGPGWEIGIRVREHRGPSPGLACGTLAPAAIACVAGGSGRGVVLPHETRRQAGKGPMDLKNKVAVITGAGSGIGEATVRVFLDAGARVVAVDLNPELTRTCEGADRSVLRCVVGDVAIEATSADYVNTALGAFGRIDVMICNAGIALPRPIHETAPEEWDRVMGVNVKAIYYAARHVVPVMRKQGGGLFLLTGSISSVCGMELQGVYGPSKGAVIQIARTMAVDYARDNIRV